MSKLFFPKRGWGGSGGGSGSSSSATSPTYVHNRGGIGYSTGGRVVRYETAGAINIGPAVLTRTDTAADGTYWTATEDLICTISASHYSAAAQCIFSVHGGTFTEADTDKSDSAYMPRVIPSDSIGSITATIALSAGQSLWVRASAGNIDTNEDDWYQVTIVAIPQ